MEVIGRVESGTETESRVWNNGRGRTTQDAYTDVGGRKRQEQVFETESRHDAGIDLSPLLHSLYYYNHCYR